MVSTRLYKLCSSLAHITLTALLHTSSSSPPLFLDNSDGVQVVGLGAHKQWLRNRLRRFMGIYPPTSRLSSLWTVVSSVKEQIVIYSGDEEDKPS
ncbi:hypothetical protein D1007_37932 [Hordeum vulgare]|nr:hypothetical protein D1007_37932 [Hordeum vulgare]